MAQQLWEVLDPMPPPPYGDTRMGSAAAKAQRVLGAVRASNNTCSSPKRGGQGSRGEGVTSADTREGEGEDVHCDEPKLARKRKC